MGQIDSIPLGKTAFSEKFPKRLVIKVSQASQLQFEQMVLFRIHVDGVNVTGPRQSIVEGIASSRRDDDDSILWREFQSDPIESGILPALIIDDISSVNEVEPSLAKSFGDHVFRQFEEASIRV